jgi:hypothetical protein
VKRGQQVWTRPSSQPALRLVGRWTTGTRVIGLLVDTVAPSSMGLEKCHRGHVQPHGALDITRGSDDIF